MQSLIQWSGATGPGLRGRERDGGEEEKQKERMYSMYVTSFNEIEHQMCYRHVSNTDTTCT